MLGRRQPRARQFTYEPRYYDPAKEKKEGRQIKFKRQQSRKALKNRSLIWLIILLGAVIYVIYFLSKLGQS